MIPDASIVLRLWPRIRQAVTASLLVLTSGSVMAEQPDGLGLRLADGYVRPAMAELANSAAALEKSLSAWCAPSGASLAHPAGHAFRRVALAWAGVEFLRFGPLVQGNRYERLAFWPDTRGVMLRQVRALLAAADPALLAPGTLAARSVAVQGLPALEYVLYGEPAVLSQRAAPGFAYACGYAQAVAGNIAGVSRELAQAWSAQGEYGREFTAPAPANALYRSQQEVAAEALKAMSTGLQFARNIKLLPVLGAAPDAARPQRAAFWRSGLAVTTLQAGVHGIAAFYAAGAYRLPAGEAWLDGTVRAELASAQRALASVRMPVAQAAVAPSDERRHLELAALILKNAKDVVDQNLAPALGVTIGFNALDGD